MAEPVSLDMFAAGDANIRTISVKDLMAGDSKSAEELFLAAKDSGFFYLDCRGHLEGALLERVDAVYEAHKATCDLPLEEKMKYFADVDHKDGELVVIGYKYAGHQTGPVEGKRDGFEGFVIFDYALSQVPRDQKVKGPETLSSKRVLLEDILGDLGDVGRAVLKSLSISLGMDEKSFISECHRAGQESTTGLGLLKYMDFTPESKGVGHIAHTDTGSLSMVFSDVPGLQVLAGDEWKFIMPKPGHLVCNVGDSLNFLSGNRLTSSLHRVVPHPDAATSNKYTTVYLMRPETEAIFTDPTGKKWKSLDWHNMKMRVLSSEQEQQAKSSVLTGKEGYLGLWDPESAPVVTVS